jgi:hypothetical protein
MENFLDQEERILYSSANSAMLSRGLETNLQKIESIFIRSIS